MNEEHWAAILFAAVLVSVICVLAIVVKSGWSDWFIR